MTLTDPPPAAAPSPNGLPARARRRILAAVAGVLVVGALLTVEAARQLSARTDAAAGAVAAVGALVTLLAAGFAGHRLARRGRTRPPVPAGGHGLASMAVLAQRCGLSVALTDRDGRIVWAGPGFSALVGRPPQAVVGWPLADLLAPSAAAAERAVVQSLLREAIGDAGCASQPAASPHRELAVSMDDGRVLWLELIAHAHRDASGAVVGAVVGAVDVGARKDGERRLAVALADAASLSQELGWMATVARHAVNGIVLTDVEGRVTWVNPGFEQMSGRSLEDMLGRKPGEVLQCEQTDPAEVARVRSAIAGRARCTAELLNRAKDGRTYWVRLDLQPLLAADGSHRGFMAIQTDVTERRRLIDELQAGKALVEAVFEAIPLPVAMKGRDGRLQRVNAAAAAFFGRPAEALLGRMTADILPGEPGRAQDQEDALLLRERGARRYEATVARELGPPVHLLVSKRTVLDAQGVPLGLVAALVDVSAQHEAEQASRAAREAAEASNRAQSAFLATMSHEIRTPMNGVIGNAELLARDRQLDADQAALVDTILASATSLLELIDGMLDFSKVESGRLVLASTPFDLVDLVAGVGRDLAAPAARRGMALEVSVQPGLAPGRVGDPLRVRQVLTHLVGNAVKFGRAGRGTVRLRVEAAGPAAVRFEVSDDGIGMDADTVARLFRPFTQAEASSTRRHGGAGLGLAISHRLVRQMGGTIEVDSRLGKGSTFRVTVPLTPGPAPALDAERAPDAGADLVGVECLIAPWPTLPVDDLSAWLVAAGAQVRRLGADGADPGLAAVGPLLGGIDEPGAPPRVLLVAADDPKVAVPHISSMRVLRIGRGRRGTARVDTTDTIDLDLLRRTPFLQAVAAAAGRASVPVVAPPVDPGERDERVAPPTDAQARASGQWILVVEDDPVNRRLVTRQLARLGFAAEVVDDGVQGHAAWMNHRHALVLTDLQMPCMDGLGLARSIRASESRLGLPRTPVLVLTANADQGEAARARAAGVDEYLVKPIPLAQLRAALNHWMPAPRTPAPAVTGRTETESGNPCSAAGTVVDLGVLIDLVGDDPATVAGLVDEFRRCAVRCRGRLLDAWRATDLAGMAGAAHALKSAARSMGAAALAATCEAIEQGARAQAPAISGALVALFEDRVEAVLRALPVGAEASE
jgi:PAS domain S-box-containing protein